MLKTVTILIGLSLLSTSFQSSKPQEFTTGWASVNGGTSGGAGGDTIRIETRNDLLEALQSNTPVIIIIRDTIVLTDGERIDVVSNNISIIGQGNSAMIRDGGLKIYGNNVIIQNLSIGGSYRNGHWDGKGDPGTDALTLYGSNIWVDHCDLFNSWDGLLDVSSNDTACGDLITVSWTRFSNHNKVMLIGSSDRRTSNRNHLRVTVHHCWFDGTARFFDETDNEYHRVEQRMPRVRYGDVHVFNNYYESVKSYCIAARIESDVYVENNYFRNLEDAHFRDDIGKGKKDPELVARGNFYDNVKGRKEAAGKAFNPADFYSYIPDPAILVPANVMNGAGKFNRCTNSDPVAINDTVKVDSAEINKFFPLNNDSDPDRDSIRITMVMNKPAGEVRVYPDYILYTPPKSPVKKDLIQYQIIDFEGGVDTAGLVVLSD